MYFASFGFSFAQIGCQRGERCTFGHAYRSCLLRNKRLWPHPDDVVYIHVVAENDLLSTLNINDGSQIGLVKTEEIEERTILPESIGIACIIEARLAIAWNENYSL